ncbi:site-specific integrase [Vibrio tubiashii]|uniref:Site-specific integrase n=1 Tax=Vibrio tubiashii TaxID=29498 RepID=A0AAE5GPH3_9VIBR|nr:site-specific integrase [Vibrio tubiashii]NOI80558.1 site-specific integrase [Vibrio tubiashii]
MRYLTLKPNGKWQFRFQIPYQFRQHFNNRREVKKTLHVSSKQEAYLLGIKHELAIKQFMSEVMLGGYVHDFDEARARSLVSNVANKGIQQINEVTQKVSNDAVFSAALRQARATQDILGGAEAVSGQFTLDLSMSGALRVLQLIYPDEQTPRQKAQALIEQGIVFDSAAKNSAAFDLLFNKLVLVFKCLIDARLAFETLKFEQLAFIVTRIQFLSEHENLVSIEQVQQAHQTFFVDSPRAKLKRQQVANLRNRKKNDVTNHTPRSTSSTEDINQTHIPQELSREVVPSEDEVDSSCHRQEISELTKQVAALTDVLVEKEESKIVNAYELIEEYYREAILKKKADLRGKKETEKDFDHINATKKKFLDVVDVIGKEDVATWTSKDGYQALVELGKLPHVRNNDQRFKNLLARERIELNKTVQYPLIDTADRYIQAASTVLNWAEKKDYIKSNLLKGVAKPKKGKQEVDDAEPFTLDDIRTILSFKSFILGKGNRNTKKKKMLHYQYWFVLLMMATGARPSEIAQLQIKDIKEKDGILCFEINDEEETKRMKTGSAKRYVPVHSHLFTLGFDLMLKDREPSEFLFDELEDTNHTSRYGAVYDWFSYNFTKPMGLTKQKKSPYSFRHWFIDCFKQAGTSDHVCGEIVGHVNKNITYRVYGSRVNLKLLKEEIEKIDLEEITKGVVPFQGRIAYS